MALRITASTTRPQANATPMAPGRRAAVAGLLALVPALTVAAPGESKHGEGRG